MNVKRILKSDCDLCYECVEMCPTGALYTDCCGTIYHDGEDCQYCEVCSDVCPMHTIEIVREDENE